VAIIGNPDSQTYYHGTKVDLKVGDLIGPGYASNYGERKQAKFVYMAATLEAAIWGAELAVGGTLGRIYIVEPLAAQSRINEIPVLAVARMKERTALSWQRTLTGSHVEDA